MKKVFRISLIVVACLHFLFVLGCRSTSVDDVAAIQIPEQIDLNKDDNVFRIYADESLNKINNDQRYIFIRLYKPFYDNPLCSENLLNNCIKFVNVSSEFSSHSAIGFSLDDVFYGLTSSNKNHNLEIERCTFIDSNEYMKKCNPYKSVEITYALAVSEVEYYKIKNMVEYYYKNPATKYDVKQNFKIAKRSMKRKFVWTKEEKKFANHCDESYKDTFEPDRSEFVCSSFIAYVLANCVDEIKYYFEENKIDSNFVVPSDLAYIPGMVKLFKTTWIDYNVGARNAALIYSALSPYYHEQFCQGVNE